MWTRWKRDLQDGENRVMRMEGRGYTGGGARRGRRRSEAKMTTVTAVMGAAVLQSLEATMTPLVSFDAPQSPGLGAAGLGEAGEGT